MEIINNRYKISECLEIDNLMNKYVVVDLIQENRKVMLYLLKDSSYMKKFIHYCMHHFYHISSLSHPQMTQLMSFGIIDSIDDKRTNEDMFFYTTELIEEKELHDPAVPLTPEEILTVYRKLSRLLDYLHFHGFYYKHLSIHTCTLFKSNGELEVKTADLITLYLKDIENKYAKMELSNEDAPELAYGIDVGPYTDVFSVGAVLYQLYTGNEFQYQQLVQRLEQLEAEGGNPWEKEFLQIIKNATKLDFVDRYATMHGMNRAIQHLYGLEKPIEVRSDVETLTLKTPLIGRDSELNGILTLKNYWEKCGLVLLHGSKGIGKTRLINETRYQMIWNHIHVFHHSMTKEKNGFYQTVTFLLKKILRISSFNTINKYAEELVKLMPEIGMNKKIMPSRELREDREILRLYDRVSNFIIEAVGNQKSMIIIDDFHDASKDFIEFIDYFIKINQIKRAPIVMLLGYSDEAFLWPEARATIERWQLLTNTMDVKLSRLTVEETAKMVRYILGWNRDPLRFATRIMKETEGNPALIEEALKELYMQKVLYVDYSTKYDCFSWQSVDDDYTKISLPENLDNAMISLLATLDERTIRVLEIVSLFSTSVSREIIAGILGKEEDYFPYLSRLTQLKILNEKLEDWGYTYGFYRYQLKSYIYGAMGEAEKVRLHQLVSTILEEQYNREGRENKEELIYHLFQSNQRDKAIFYCIEAGDSMFHLKIYSQAMVFYRRAYEHMRNASKPEQFQLLLKIGEVSQNQGNNQEALSCYQEVRRSCDQPELLQYAVEAGCKIAHIYITRNETEKAAQEIDDCMKMAQEINYQEGALKAGYLLTRIHMHNKNVARLEELCDASLNLAQKLSRYDYVGMFLSQKGVAAFFRGEVLKAKEYFHASVGYLEKSNRLEEISRPINNIGVILQDHFLNVKEARSYFERASKIAQQYHRMDDLFRAQNNIADSYMQEADYEKAIEVLHSNVGLAMSYEDESMKLLGYSNLIICYTLIGEYRQAYQYVIKAQNEFGDYPMGAYLGEAFFESMVQFYMVMGDYEKVLEITERFVAVNPELTGIRLVMSAFNHFARTRLDRPVAHGELFRLLEQYGNTSYIKARREVLQMAVEYFYEIGDLEQARQLMEEDGKLVESFDNNRLGLKRKCLACQLDPKKVSDHQIWEQLLQEDDIEAYDKETKWQIYRKLGQIWFEERDYYRATSYYLNAMEIIQGLLKRTPKEYKLSYLKVKQKYDIRRQLLNMEKIICEGEDARLSGPGEEEIDLDSFFDVGRFQEMFHNPAFYELALQQYQSLISVDIDSVEGLVASLSSDVAENLKLILRLAGKFVLATRGALIAVDEEGSHILTSFGTKLHLDEIRYLLEKAAVSRTNLLIENHLAHGLDVGLSMNKEARAMICLPITSAGKAEVNRENDRRRTGMHEKSKLIGYLYLETDKVFNNFSQETYLECQKLLPLAGIMMSNYQLQISSSMDKMTGAYIRKNVEKVLQEHVDAAQESNFRFSIIMCDIDHFKHVNDTYGHQRGDTVLAGAGRVIRESIRSLDYVGRYGGEEFIILLPGAGKTEAFQVAEHIRENFRAAKLLGEDKELTISCGVSSCPEDGLTKEMLIERADQALYNAKEQGRNRTILWADGIGFTDRRTDKLAGIITGNVVQDQRNVLVLAEAIEILTESKEAKDKIYVMLGRLIEILEAEEGMVFTVEDTRVTEQFYRKRFLDDWVPELSCNMRLVDKVIQLRQGDYLIDWEDISQIDVISGTPNWKSVIAVPIFYNGELHGVIYLAVPVKEKEFDFSAYNLVKIVSGIIGPIIRNLKRTKE